MLTIYEGVIKLDFAQVRLAQTLTSLFHSTRRFDVVVFKIVTGDGPTTFRIQDWDLLAEYPNSAFVVDIDSGGTTYVMLKLLNVPEDENGSLISFREQGTETPLHMHAVSFDARDGGILRSMFATSTVSDASVNEVVDSRWQAIVGACRGRRPTGRLERSSPPISRRRAEVTCSGCPVTTEDGIGLWPALWR